VGRIAKAIVLPRLACFEIALPAAFFTGDSHGQSKEAYCERVKAGTKPARKKVVKRTTPKKGKSMVRQAGKGAQKSMAKKKRFNSLLRGQEQTRQPFECLTAVLDLWWTAAWSYEDLITRNPAIINALRKQSPRNSRTEGRGMFDRSRKGTFMLLKLPTTDSASITYHLEPSAFLCLYQIARPGR